MDNNSPRWDRASWLWVFLCAAGICATVPVARGIQKTVYETAGKEFFTFLVLFIVFSLFIALLYFFIFRLKVNKPSQYVWLFICAGLYVFFTILLGKQPEEAVHLLEYGLLSYLIFKALSCKIRDWTVYISAALLASLFGIADEFLQWLTPSRFWGYKDIGINALGAGIFMLALSQGIRPGIINMPVKRFSISTMAGIITTVLIVLGLCLSNTPDAVKRYTAVSGSLSWLLNEEPMTEYGKIITSFSLQTAWILILVMSGVVWTFSEFWKRRLKDD